MDPIVTGGLITGGAALANSAFNIGAGANMNKKNRAWNEAMMKAQMRYQQGMFDKANAYNTPLAQRQRMEAAGLNPALMYGGGKGLNIGNAQQQTGASPGSLGTQPLKSDIPPLALAESKVLGTQAELNQSSHQLQMAERGLKLIQTGLIKSQKTRQDIENLVQETYAMKRAQVELNRSENEAKLASTRAQLTNLERLIRNKDWKRYDETGIPPDAAPIYKALYELGKVNPAEALNGLTKWLWRFGQGIGKYQWGITPLK